MQQARRSAAGGDREQLLKTLLRRSWHGLVLRALADGPTRFVDIRRKVRAGQAEVAGEGGRRPPGDGQISAVLRELVDLGLAVKHEPATPLPWELTGQGRTALLDLETFVRLGTGEIDPQSAGDSAAHARDTQATPPRSTLNRKTNVDGRAVLMVQPRGEIDVTVAHPARRYNFWLGGQDNFQVDRESAEQLERAVPGIRAGVLENRRAHRRMVHYLAAKAGIRQFVDVGTGLPAPDNTHEVVQGVDPSSRILYVDNDPLVMVHAQALLTGSPQGVTAYLQADLREPAAILTSPVFHRAIDRAEPVALLLIAVLHFIPGEGAAKPLVDQMMDALPAGSFLAITHATLDFQPVEVQAQALHDKMRRDGLSDFWPRPKDEIMELFDGLEIVNPGMVPSSQWRPSVEGSDVDLRAVGAWACVGRKP